MMDQNGSGSLNFIHQIYGFILHELEQVNRSNDHSNRFYLGLELQFIFKNVATLREHDFFGRFISFVAKHRSILHFHWFKIMLTG